jgi:hypothetical protein
MATFPISYLRDDFEDNAIAAAWTKTQTGSATGAETSGQAKFTLPSSTAGSHQALYTSNANYDLTGDAANVSVGTMVATGVAATAYILQLFVDALNGYQWIQLSGTLKAQKVVAGVTTDLFTVAWSSSTHKYLRIRESGGTVFFDTSTSASAGASWTNRASVTVSGNVAVTALFVQFGASCGNIASPGSLQLDMFNLVLPAPTRTWRWTDADWQISNRLRPITLASTGNKQGVIVTAAGKDSSGNLIGTLRYFAGPLGSSSGGYAALTEYSTLVAAQGNPFDIPIDGRVDLPSLVDARIMRLYHSSDNGASGTIREFYPRRMLQSDDIEAESIKALNIAAASITADRLVAHSITATQIGVVNLDASAYITAGGARVKLDNTGIHIVAATRPSLEFEEVAQLNWKLANGTYVGWISAVNDNSQGASVLGIGVDDPASATAPIWVYNNLVQINTTLKAAAGLNVGTASGAATGEIKASGGGTFGGAGAFGGNVTQTGNRPYLILNDTNATGKRTGVMFQDGGAEQFEIGVDAAIDGTRSIYLYDGVAGAFRWVIGPNGRLGYNIGSAEPASAMAAFRGENTSSSNFALIAQNATPTNLMALRNDGGAGSAQVIVAWTVTSDRKLKRNIKDVTKGLADLKRLRPRTYDRIAGAKKEEHGFVAQELQLVFPEMVNECALNEEGDRVLGIAYTELIPVLVRSIQELSDRVDGLEAR